MKALILKQKQVLLFILAGGLSAVMEIGSFKFFSMYIPSFFPKELNLWGIHYPFSNIFSTSLGIISNYFFSIWFVFERGKHSKKREFFYFMVVSVISTILSLIFFQVFFSWVFTKDVDLVLITISPKIISKVAAIGLVAILNYSIKKQMIFNG